MTKTSAIFGVVSVLTAAIVGGVFIRKKIIYDALYWKAWVEAEGRWKREIKGLEGDINVLTSDLKEKNKNKRNIEKGIEEYEKNMQQLIEDIGKHEEQMKVLGSHTISTEVGYRITKNLDKQKILEGKIEGFVLQISKLVSDNENISSDNDLAIKLNDFKTNLKTQKEKLQKYVDRRILQNKQFEKYKEKMKQTLENKQKIMKEIENSKSLFTALEFLIKQLEEKLSKKTLQLSNLRTQGPVVII